jgi:hypothetical protein
MDLSFMKFTVSVDDELFLTMHVMKPNLIHYVSSVYLVTITLHVSGLLVAHHHKVKIYTVYATDGTCVCFSLLSAGHLTVN